MDISERKRRARLMIIAMTAFGCSVAALSGTLAASTHGPLGGVQPVGIGLL